MIASLFMQGVGVSSDEEIYRDKNILVTPALVTTNNGTYSLRNVSAVKVVSSRRKAVVRVVLVFLGLVLLAIGILLLLRGRIDMSIPLSFIGLFFILMFSRRASSYELVIGTSGGDQVLITSTDKRYIESLRQQVEVAFKRAS